MLYKSLHNRWLRLVAAVAGEFLAALALFFAAGFWPGMSWLVIAFLISPYGLPMAAAWLAGMIGGVNGALKDFIFG